VDRQLGRHQPVDGSFDQRQPRFTGWQKTTFTFTAQTANDVLSFLAVGTPNGEPPFSVLDGVSAKAVAPVAEPGAFAMLGLGGLGLAAVARRRK